MTSTEVAPATAEPHQAPQDGLAAVGKQFVLDLYECATERFDEADEKLKLGARAAD
ncbi:MAG TPA: hypothetical protein VMK32_04285 [Burkholderiaceae bacterium]|nr:hypothetical protein [Burkholderiaceae bacterium]